MSNRYKRLKIYNNFKYSPSCPIDILKGAIYIDTLSNDIVFQLKFINVQSKNIKAVYIQVTGYNDLNEKIEQKEYQYLDLNASENQEFGTEELKILGNNTIRNIQVEVKYVIYQNNEKWENINKKWYDRVKLVKFDKNLSSFVKHKAQELGIEGNISYYPTVNKEFWTCICGAYNSVENDVCYSCNCNKDMIINQFEKEKLEKGLKEYEEKQKAKKEEEKIEMKKNIKIFAFIVPLIIVIIIIVAILGNKYSSTNEKIDNRKMELKSGDYVLYTDSKGTERKCRVLYDSNSEYGLQLIGMEKVEDVTLGKLLDNEKTMEDYNNAITILNDKAKEYMNNEFSTSARCLGSNPKNIQDDSQMYHYSKGIFNSICENYKDSDSNYEKDLNKLEELKITFNFDYWLASRDIIYNKSATTDNSFSYLRFFVRSSVGFDNIVLLYNNGTTSSFERTYGVIPVFTLKENVEINTGEGTISNLYTLKIKN